MKKLERAELCVQTERNHRASKPKSLAPILGFIALELSLLIGGVYLLMRFFGG